MPNDTAEFAHVLFLDIVGYTSQPQETQDTLVRTLNKAVRSLDTFTQAAQSQDAVALPTGDGMALVFFRNPLAPAECAVALFHDLKATPEMQVRMGIHSGPVTRNTDIRGQANVTGNGINIAQRIMDSGASGQILLSSDGANILRQYEKYQDALLNWGEHTVKNGVKLHIYGLFLDNAGSANPPAWSKATAPVTKAIPVNSDKTVVLLY